MTTVAMAHWRRLDQDGTDRCSLSRSQAGWMLIGHASWQSDTTLEYVVRCDPDWRTLSADVTGTHLGDPVALRMMRGPLGWTVNEVLQPGTEKCTDIDLCFTPATNLLPLRRLTFDGATPMPVSAAWLVPDLDRIQRLDQTYAGIGEGVFTYASANFSARIETHPSGFVTRYPGLWDGWVDA